MESCAVNLGDGCRPQRFAIEFGEERSEWCAELALDRCSQFGEGQRGYPIAQTRQ